MIFLKWLDILKTQHSSIAQLLTYADKLFKLTGYLTVRMSNCIPFTVY